MNKALINRLRNLNELIHSYKELYIDWILFLILAVFAFQSILFAINSPENFPPDEVYHNNLIKVYSEGTNILPTISNTEEIESLPYGAIKGSSSFLYHALMVIPYRTIRSLDLANDSYLILRLINVVISVFSVLICFKLMKEITKSKILIYTTLAFIVSQTMYVFMSGSITYDILQIFFANISFLYLIRFFRKQELLSLLFLIISWFALLFTKWSSAPIVFAEFLILLYILFKNKFNLRQIYTSFKYEPKVFYLLLLTITIVIPFVLKIGSNYVEYGSVFPSCTQVLTFEQCMVFGPFKRNTELINQDIPVTMTIFQFGVSWAKLLFKSLNGIFSGKAISANSYTLLTFFSIYILSGISFIRNSFRDKRGSNYLDSIFLFIFFVYTSALFYQNYSQYLEFGVFGVAIQGRYLLPVMLPILFLVSKYLLMLISNKYLRYAFFTTLLLFNLYNFYYIFRMSMMLWK